MMCRQFSSSSALATEAVFFSLMLRRMAEPLAISCFLFLCRRVSFSSASTCSGVCTFTWPSLYLKYVLLVKIERSSAETRSSSASLPKTSSARKAGSKLSLFSSQISSQISFRSISYMREFLFLFVSSRILTSLSRLVSTA